MKIYSKLLATVAALFLLNTAAVSADDDNESPDVWAIVEEEWSADARNDKKWADRLLVDDFVAWGKDHPAPRDKASTKMWDRFGEKLGEIVAYDLYPLSIVIHGDTAVAHYLYTSAYEDKDGEIEINNGRYTDVFVRTEDGWRYLAWHGGDD